MKNIKLHFPAGVYSSKKNDIKAIFKLLDYNYKGGFQKDGKLICSWIRPNDKANIKGIFNGSVQACDFLISCIDSEESIFLGFQKYYGAILVLGEVDKSKSEDLLLEARLKVEKWFTIPKQESGEPQVFYNGRLKKANESYDWFVQQEYKRLKEHNGII